MSMLECRFCPLQPLEAVAFFGWVRNAPGIGYWNDNFIEFSVTHLLGAVRLHPASGRAVALLTSVAFSLPATPGTNDAI
jgi:hypothetical protein